MDVEAMGEYRGVPSQARLTWLSMATTGLAVAIPFGHPNGDRLISPATKKLDRITRKYTPIPAVYDDPPVQMLPSQVFEILRPLFFSDRIKIAHNATYDLIAMAKYFGEIVPPEYSDTIVLQWLLDENLKSKALKDLIIKYYGVDYDQEHVGRNVELWPFSKVGHYSYLDAKYTWLLWKKLQQQIEEQGLTRVKDFEMDVLGVLLEMGVTGAPVDEAAMHILIKDMDTQLVDIEGRIYQAAGQRFNLNAPAQKAAVLFAPKKEGGQGLKPWKLTDGGEKKKQAHIDLAYGDYSTDKDTLESFSTNPVVSALLEYNEISKLKSYPEAYLGVAGDKDKPRRIFDGRIHADFVQYGTTTGRFSCRQPNLQNIPRPNTELGKRIRGLFIAPPGNKLIVCDYGQIELVVFAHFANDGKLLEGFLNDVDPHTMTAAGVLGKDPAEVTGDERQLLGKGLGFATVFGAGPEKVGSMAHITTAEAKRMLEKHQRTFPEIYRLKNDIVRQCRSRKPPHVKTLIGRMRRLPTINSGNQGLRMYAERQAVSSVIQGSAADLIKLAMIRANNTLPDDMHLILTVHDELVTICPEEKADEGMEIVREAFTGEGIQKLIRLPLKADIKVVDRWSQAK